MPAPLMPTSEDVTALARAIAEKGLQIFEGTNQIERLVINRDLAR